MELDWQEDASNRHYENWRGQDFKDSISTRKSKFDLHAEFFKFSCDFPKIKGSKFFEVTGAAFRIVEWNFVFSEHSIIGLIDVLLGVKGTTVHYCRKHEITCVWIDMLLRCF